MEIDLEYFQEISAGDFNGDGFVDLAAILDSTNQSVVIFFGEESLTSFSAPKILMANIHSNTTSPKVVNAGDLNGDGFSDLAIGAAFDENNVGHVYIYLSNAAGEIDDIVDGTLEGMDAFGSAISSSMETL